MASIAATHLVAFDSVTFALGDNNESEIVRWRSAIDVRLFCSLSQASALPVAAATMIPRQTRDPFH